MMSSQNYGYEAPFKPSRHFYNSDDIAQPTLKCNAIPTKDQVSTSIAVSPPTTCNTGMPIEKYVDRIAVIDVVSMAAMASASKGLSRPNGRAQRRHGRARAQTCGAGCAEFETRDRARENSPTRLLRLQLADDHGEAMETRAPNLGQSWLRDDARRLPPAPAPHPQGRVHGLHPPRQEGPRVIQAQRRRVAAALPRSHAGDGRSPSARLRLLAVSENRQEESESKLPPRRVAAGLPLVQLAVHSLRSRASPRFPRLEAHPPPP